MNLITDTDYHIEQPSIVSIGAFDGVHRGHRQIVYRMRQAAKKLQARSVLITFQPHPRKLLQKGEVQLITSLNEKLKVLHRLGLDDVILLRFTHELSQVSARDFFEHYIYRRIHIRHFLMGYDHVFGRDRQGNFDYVDSLRRDFSFSLERVGPRHLFGQPVSSSRIRYALAAGNLPYAMRLLGRSFSVRGTVIHGHGRGRQLGYPTANLELDEERKLLPPNGVYEVLVYLPEREWRGMGVMSIGFNPTFSEQKIRQVEVHILHFSDDIYGTIMECYFRHFIRSEKKFAGPPALKAQIQKDIETVAPFADNKGRILSENLLRQIHWQNPEGQS